MTKDIETDNAGERAAVTLAALKMVQAWHPEGTVKDLRNTEPDSPFGFIDVDICVQGGGLFNGLSKVFGGRSEKERARAAGENAALEAYRMNPSGVMFITAETVEEDRKHFTPESAPFVTEGSIIYHFVFQAWGSVELTDPDAYLQHAIREHLRDPSIRAYHFLPYTPCNQWGKEDRGLVFVATLNVEQDDSIFARIAGAVQDLTFWDSVSFSYQSTTGTASIGIMQFRINRERLEARLKEFEAALRAYRRRTK